jgi:hypothetical protein
MIPWEAAADYVGQTKTVEGVIVGSHLSERSRNLYLNFSQDFWRHLSVQIPAAQIGRFRGDAESFYKGKKIRAKGQIRREGQYLRLVVSDPNDLEVIK